MKERPILFSAPMVRALLDGSKTQTRRVAKPVRHPDLGNIYTPGALVLEHEPKHVIERACPYGQPGDRLWVRETWGMFKKTPDNHVHACVRGDGRPFGFEPHYRATDTWEMPGGAWRPSIHMPRWASRITLEITGVRVERLQDISEADAIAEGCAKNHNGYYWGGPHAVSGLKQMATAVSAYQDLWESINGPGSWDANPWDWVVEFKRMEGGAA